MTKTKYDAIIIGAGISGLLMALVLCKEKKDVLVIEKNNYLGGNCRTYEIGGYHIDTGSHIITELSNGPLKILMDRYFSVVPKFTPIGSYYARWQNKLQEIPLTLIQLSYFDILSKKDRIAMVKIMIDAIANSSLNENALEKSVYDYIKKYSFSAKSIRFIDMACYFLSGKSMKETPAWRILGGSGYVDEDDKSIKRHFKKIIKFVKHNYNSQGYPLGGIQSITASILNSIPKDRIIFKINERVIKFIIKNNTIKGVQTNKEIYSANTVVYSGFVKNLPNLTNKLSKKYKIALQKIKQVKSFTLWLGLKNKMPELSYLGSEVYFDTPTQLYKLKRAIFTALPNIEKNIEFEHIQITVPEKAAVTVGVKFPSPKSPIQGLYLVGTDTNMKSMGITRASYSVLDALEFMKRDRVI
jgi:phytoene dehydrogenase-like protein